MTHRGPFQPLPFCDSVILCNILPAWSEGSQGLVPDNISKRGYACLSTADVSIT